MIWVGKKNFLKYRIQYDSQKYKNSENFYLREENYNIREHIKWKLHSNLKQQRDQENYNIEL